MPELTISYDRFKIRGAFTISRGARTVAEVVTVTITDDGAVGRGECTPYGRYGETVDSVCAQIEAVRNAVEAGVDPQELQSLLPAGAARNAVDCALWDLAAKRAGQPVWTLLGLEPPAPVETVYTLSLDTPENMTYAAANADYGTLKVKLGSDDDRARIRAVRRGNASARLIVDANEGWRVEDYQRLAPEFVELGVAMVEQPFPAGADDILGRIERVLPVCADESAHGADDLSELAGKYDIVNIKLDKTGGLTGALTMRAAAQRAGFGIMAGCMIGSSLAMAPAFLIAQGADFVDLDAPLLLAEDRATAMTYEADRVLVPPSQLWG